ncbi:MAG TPA: NAD(P)/FAD-dependent oxidoreductase [Gemmatimonadota bacterium]|nr:NAD(P)/FAD-dependent oxidoreductase [Gemmatimonadota bacterium]
MAELGHGRPRAAARTEARKGRDVERSYDLIVIGTGSAATAAASACRRAGWSVAVVDSRPFGGTCALRGCDPKKVLVGAVELVDWSRRMEGQGVRSPGASIDWPALMAFKRTFTEPVPDDRERSFVEAGIETFHGRARFTGPCTVTVGQEPIEARHVVIATGARPATLNIPGARHVITSDDFLELESLPGEIVFIGGGYISFEFAHVAAQAGAKVAVLHRGHRPLQGFDPDLVDMLAHRSRSLGIELHLTTEATAVERRDGRLQVSARAGGEELKFGADLVVHGAGRVAEIDDLDLEAATIERNEGGIAVNGYLQSVSNPAVYAAGDAAGAGSPLTPVAAYQGRIAAANLLEGNHRKADYSGIPTVVFTLPPLAAVGLLEAEAREQGLAFETRHARTGDWYSSRRIGESCSGHKVLIEKSTGRILGAHLLGTDAGEVVNLFALAIRAGLTAADLEDARFAYPTRGSDLGYMLA